MSRIVKDKELVNVRLLKEYASWIYCTNCEKTIAYLCYVTYDNFQFEFTCNCGSKGSVKIGFENNRDVKLNIDSLVHIKNRLCCPNDNSPLVTFIDKNLQDYTYKIVCSACKNQFRKEDI